MLFCDVKANPSRTGLTKQPCHKNYLVVVDLFSKHVAFIGTKFTTASAIVTCLKTWAHLHRPRSEFTLRDVAELHVQANPSRTGLTKQPCHKNYLEVVDLFFKHVAFIGTKVTTASAILTCLKT